MLYSLPFSLALLLSLSCGVLAFPTPATETAGQSISILKRSASRTPEEWEAWAKNHREMLMTKYGTPSKKRSSGTNL